jgi:hypothetical protein
MMTSQARAKTRKPPTGRPRPAGRGRVWWAAVAGAGLVAAGVIAWTASGDDDEPPAAGGSVAQFTHVHGLAIPPGAPQALLVSTHEGLIRVDDGYWSYASGQSHDFMGFAANPAQPGVLYTSGHPAEGSGLADPVGFMVSTDGGASWQVRSLAGEVDFHAMAVGDGGSVIYGWNGYGQPALHRSIDEGHTWQVVDAPQLATAGGAYALAVHPDDPDRLWAATGTGLLHSRDAGVSWQQATSGAPATAIAVDPTDPDRLVAYTAAPGDGLVESRDGGQAWTPTGWRLEAADDAVTHFAIHPDDPQRVYAATLGPDVLRSEDGGRSWQHLARAGAPATDPGRS